MKIYSSWLCLCVLGLTSCATSGELPSGVYLETRGPEAALFSSKELRLYPNRHFEFIQWTDMVGVGSQGRGRYTWRGQQLQLVFNGQSLAQRSSVQAHPLPAPPNSDLRCVSVNLRFGKEAAAGLSVLVYDKTGRMLAGASSDPTGQAQVCLARTQYPHHFTITGMGFRQVDQPWPLTSTAYNVQLAATLGPAYHAGTRLSFRVLQQSATKLVLQQQADTITLAADLRP
ncbi:hypothetical protein [Hymenobacter sedentarius]|uniref:hypothetical protein n=1 Tax=Hymenobacter sedentarius TaxID=1411621 RepID=UPI0012FD5A90|nr:hypothetical protein [Hymenobacter sedentarius]